jgi:hypothetical protein
MGKVGKHGTGKRGPEERKDGTGGTPGDTPGVGRGADGRGQGAQGETGEDVQGDGKSLGKALRLEPPTRDPIPDGPPKPKRGRGAPSKAERAEREAADRAAAAAALEQEAQFLIPLLVGFVVLPFDAIAVRRGNHWKLSPAERDAFTEATARIAVKYLPAFLLNYKEELAFLLILGGIVTCRIQKDTELDADRSRQLRGDGNPGERQNDASEAPSRSPHAG